MIINVFGSNEALFDVSFRDPPDRVAKFSGHQFCRIIVDDVIDLKHHALTHQELNNLYASSCHPVGQLGHSDDVRNNDFTGCARGLLAAALAFLTLPFPRPANRG